MAGFRIVGGDVRLETGSVVDEMVSSATNIDADKLEHIHKAGSNFGLAIGGTPVAYEEIVYVAEVASTIRGFHAMLNDTGTSTSCTFDLKINGTTALSGVVTITHGEADKAVLDGTLTTTTLAVDDVVSIALAQSANTGAQGPYAWAVIDETAP